MTPEQIAALASELAKPAYSGKTVAEIAAMLCDEPMIPNPTPRGTRPAPISFDALLNKVSQASAAKLSQMPSLPKFVDDVRNGDRAAAANWLKLAVAGGIITPDEFTNMGDLLSAEVDDDDWQSQVLGPSILEQLTGRRAITGEQITAITGAE